MSTLERADAAGPGKTRCVALVAAGAGAVMLVLCAALWWLRPPAHEGVTLSAPGFPWARAPMALPGDAGAVPPVTAAPAQAASGGASPALPITVDLCGIGRVVVPSAARDGDVGALSELPSPMGRHALHEAQARLVHSLAVGDTRQRVAARLLQQPDEDDAGMLAAWARTLLAEGLASRDAQALRWAGAACPFVPDETACRRRLARERVRAEPANALHWLEWADEEPQASEAA